MGNTSEAVFDAFRTPIIVMNDGLVGGYVGLNTEQD